MSWSSLAGVISTFWPHELALIFNNFLPLDPFVGGCRCRYQCSYCCGLSASQNTRALFQCTQGTRSRSAQVVASERFHIPALRYEQVAAPINNAPCHSFPFFHPFPPPLLSRRLLLFSSRSLYLAHPTDRSYSSTGRQNSAPVTESRSVCGIFLESSPLAKCVIVNYSAEIEREDSEKEKDRERKTAKLMSYFWESNESIRR